MILSQKQELQCGITVRKEGRNSGGGRRREGEARKCEGRRDDKKKSGGGEEGKEGETGRKAVGRSK